MGEAVDLSRTVGWFTTNAPVRVVSTGDLATTARRTGPVLRRSIRLGEIPVPQVIANVGGFRQVRSDIFMVSYIDYRTLPGARLHESIAAHHISNASTADDAQFWISRTDDGLALRARHPDTLVSQARLLAEVWGPGYEKETHYLRTYFATLRRKLEADPARPVHLITEPGLGYRLITGSAAAGDA